MVLAASFAALVLALSPLPVDLMAEVSLRAATLAEAERPVEFSVETQQIYQERNGAPLWITRPDAATAIPALIDRFADARSHGLDPDRYPLWRLRAASPDALQGSVQERAGFEVALTSAVFAYIADLSGQRRALPRPENPRGRRQKQEDLAGLLREMVAADEPPAEAIEHAAPAGRQYTALRDALVNMNRIVADGGWPTVPDGPLLRLGDHDDRVPDLRARLNVSPPADQPADLYDKLLVRAVRDLQWRCGLATDGVVGPQTLAALNTSAEQRRDQIIFSLERLRGLPRDLGERYVRVDLQKALLQVVDSDTVVTQMRAIVGRPRTPTPLVSSRIQSLEVNPYWNIPQKLARRDVLPKARRDAAYLVEHDIRVYTTWRPGAAELDPLTIDWPGLKSYNMAYKLQQQPGPTNPLGRVKFLFSNPYSVYIHDTPHAAKFRERERFYSSGCIRIEKPLELAAALLGDRYPEFIAALDAGETRTLNLPRAVPVHLVYLTAWVTEDGSLCFRDDVYGFDAGEKTETLIATRAADALPGPHGPGVDMHEIGTRVVADAANPLR